MANCLLLKRLFRYTWQEIKGAHNPGNSNRGRKEGIHNRSRSNRIWFPGDLNTGNISNNNNYIADKKVSIHWLPFARHWNKHCILFNAHENSAKYILLVNFIRNSVQNSKMTSILCSSFYQEMEPTFPTDLIFWLAFTHATQPEWHYSKSGPRLLSCEPSLFPILITQSKHKRKQNQWTSRIKNI